MKVRVAAHIHSEWSYDGRWSLSDLGHAFRRRGYSAVLMSEHDRGFTERRWKDFQASCREASSESFLFVPGLEYSDSTNSVHILTWGDTPFVGESLDLDHLLALLRAHRPAAVLAHPGKGDTHTLITEEWLAVVHGVEFWNRKYDGRTPNVDALRLLDRFNLLPFCGLDFHSDQHFFPLAMIVDVDSFDHVAIVESIRAGRCRPEAFGIAALKLPTRIGKVAAHSALRTRPLRARWRLRSKDRTAA